MAPVVDLTLARISVRHDGAFGVLLLGDIPFALTLERTYPTGDPTVERPIIPRGTYLCTPTIFNRGGYPTFEIHVPNHSRLLFHKGNVEEDSEGCVLVAERFSELRGKTAILSSAEGFGEFMRRAPGRAFHLEVRE